MARQAVNLIIRGRRDTGSSVGSIGLTLSLGDFGIKIGDSNRLITATVTNSTKTPQWYMVPESGTTYGRIVDVNDGPVTSGKSVYFSPPRVMPSPLQLVTIVCFIEDGGQRIEKQITVTLQNTDSTTPVLGGSYARNTSFLASSLPSKYRNYYIHSLKNIKEEMERGRTYGDGAGNYYNDLIADIRARTNTRAFNVLGCAYTITKDPEIVEFFAYRMELIVKGMKNNVGDVPSHYFFGVSGGSPGYKELKAQAWFATPVTLTNDDGTTFSTSWKNWPKMLLKAENSSSSPVIGDYSGTDIFHHDYAPRRSPLVMMCTILEQNQDMARATGSMTVKEIVDWYYDWNYKDLAFWRYRGAWRQTGYEQGGIGVMRDGQIDWKEDFAHDNMQQLQFDFFNWEWARIREGPTSARAVFWEKVYKSHLPWIQDSIFYVTAPNGHEVPLFNHWFGRYRREWRGKTIDEAWRVNFSNRYSDDQMPAVLTMTYFGAPSMERIANALANHFSQIGWMANNRIAAGIVGPSQKYSDGSSIVFPSNFPRSGGIPVASNYYYEYNKDYDPIGGKTGNLASVNNKFKRAMGFWGVVFDPTANRQNIKRFHEVSALWGNYTPAKGKTTSSYVSSDYFHYKQLTDFLIGVRYDVDPETL